MKNILLKSVCLLSVGLLSLSCIKESFPEGDELTKSQVSNNSKSLEFLLGAIPVSMVSYNTAEYLTKYEAHYDFGIGGIHLLTEYMLEDLATLSNTPGYNRFYSYCSNAYQGDAFISCGYPWTCYYKWIKLVNDVISIVNPDTASEMELKYLGQAYTYRASYYLDLARMYEFKENSATTAPAQVLDKALTVPIVTEKTTEEQAKNNPRAPRDTVYKFILDDLKKAEDFLTRGTREDSYKVPTLNAVYGLYARLYLEWGEGLDKNTGDYTKAIEYADKVIGATGKSPLTESEWEDPKNGFNNGSSNKSWIWGLTVSSEVIENLVAFPAHISSEATWGYGMVAQIGINRSLYEQIDDKDFRKRSWMDPDRDKFAYKFADGVGGTKTFLGNANQPALKDYQNIKFRPYAGNYLDYKVGNCSDILLMRLEEMYFIKMEALAKKGNLSDAGGVLKSFMDFRITDKSYDVSSYTSTESAFIDEMMKQKRVEFWGEGILFYDYKRLGRSITRGYPGTNHASVYCYNFVGRSPQWNFVITRREYQNNVAITKELNNPDPSGKLVQWQD